VGQTGNRAGAPKDLGFASAYVFGEVCPLEGKAAALIMPICNTVAMNHHLREISSQVAAPRFREGRLCPCRGDPPWCRLAPQPRTRVPSNITLLELPPYSPELNPVERIWRYLRNHWLANSIFRDLEHIMDACETAWQRFVADHGLIRSLCAVAWVPASPSQ
jgi:hypothetical protein